MACVLALYDIHGGTGTVMRAETVRGYAEQAGFSQFEILPIENDFYRFYLMS